MMDLEGPTEISRCPRCPPGVPDMYAWISIWWGVPSQSCSDDRLQEAMLVMAVMNAGFDTRVKTAAFSRIDSKSDFQ